MAAQPPQWLVDWLSAPRLGTFLSAAGGDADRALALYTWNGRVSSAMLRDLADLEVLVRNAYDRAIDARWRGSAPWLLDRSFPVLRVRTHGGRDRNHRTRQIVAQAVADAGGTTAPIGKIVAQLNFGFWRYLTTRRHEHEVWVPYVRHAFVSGTSRHSIDGRMERLRALRNRIAHHEAIIARDLWRDHHELLEVCGRISADVRAHVEATSAIPGLLRGRP